MAEDNPFLQFLPNDAPLRAPRLRQGPKQNDPLTRRLSTPASTQNGQRVTAGGQPFYKDIVKTGAPVKVRAAVASVQKNADQLKALQNYYPTARAYGTDNFIYRDPKNSNKWTIFNPVGFDKGDLVVGGRIAAATVGAIPGAVAGAPVAGPVGSLVGGAATSTTAGVLYDKAVQALTGAEDTRSFGQQAQDAAIETGLNVAIPAAGGKVVKFLRNAGRAGDDAAVQAFRTLGSQAPANASGGTGRKMLAGALDSSWLSSGTMAARTEQAVNAIKTGIDKVTSQFATGVSGKADAGKIVKDAANSYITGFRAESSRLYDEVDKLIKPDARVDIANLEKVVDDIAGRYSGDPEVAALIANDPAFKKLFDIVDVAKQKGGLQYQSIKDLRTFIGQEVNSGKGKLIDVFGSADTNALYGALSDDMTLAARTLAGNQGEAAAKAASDFWRQGRQVIDTRIQPVVGAPRDNLSGEKVYDRFINVAQREPSLLDDWQNVIPAPERAKLGAFELREMGNAPKGAEGVLVEQGGATFNPNRFASRYNDVFNNTNAAPARNFFFGSNPALSETADAAFVASNSLKGAALEKNSSRTFATSGTAGGVGGALAALPQYMSGMAADAPLLAGLDATGTALTAAAAWNIAQKPLAMAMTNPTVERILARPMLQSALPEVTSRLPQWAIPSARTLVGATAQEPMRQELNYDSNAVLAQPPAPVLRTNESDNPFAQFME